MRVPGHIPFALLFTASLAAQRPTDDLLADLVTTDRAIDAQLELLRRGEPVAQALGQALRLGWSGHPNRSVARGAVARVLMELGPAGSPAFDELVACVRDPYVDAEIVRFAAMALERVGPFAGDRRAKFLEFLEGHPTWLRGGAGLLRREFFERWSHVASSLVVDARGATVDDLLATLADVNLFALVAAARALTARQTEFVGRTEPIADALRDVILAPHERRERITWYVGRFPQGWRRSEDIVRWIRTEASLALIAYAPEHELCMLGHSQRLFALDPAVQIDAADALGRLRRPDAGTWLIDAARRGPRQVALAALAAIERTGPSFAYLGPALLELQSTAEPDVRATAERVQRIIAPDLDSIVPIRPHLEIIGVGLPAESAIPLALETQRLEAWLDRGGGRNRVLLQQDVRHIDRYHALSVDDGGPVAGRIRWIPVRTAPDEFLPGFWSPLEQAPERSVVSAAPRDAVGPDRERLRPLPWIVELVPANRKDPVFGRDDLEIVRRTRSSSYFRIGQRRAGEFTGLKQHLLERSGSVATVIDGLAIWLLAVDEQTSIVNPIGGFGVLPAAADRSAALSSLMTRER